MALLNVRSIANKSLVLNDLVLSKKLDFLFLTETWQRDMKLGPLIELCPKDYTFISLPRISGRGRGLTAVSRIHFVCRFVSIGSFSSFELQMIKVGRSNPFYCILIYPPPGPNSSFLIEFADFLSSVLKLSRFIIFNIHADDVSDSFASSFINITVSFNLIQHVSGPTHN